jgi:Cysteine-rich secretory protein family
MPTLPDLPQTESAIVALTNAFRKQHALSELKPNAALTAAARAFAAYLGKTGKFAHEADGREPQQRAEAQGYHSCLIAENLALNLDSRGFVATKLAQDVIEGWKASPGHRANLLQKGVTEIGVGVVQAPNRHPKFVSVQVFARPSSLQVSFVIENRSGREISYSLGEESETLPAHARVSHTSCEAGPLKIDKAEPGSQRLEPHDGDFFLVAASRGGALKVERSRR